MKVTTSGDEVTVVLRGAEAALLRLALKRATFEDTPPGRQREILELANELLRALGADEPA